MLGNFKKKLSSAIQGGLNISESLQQQVRQRISTITTPTTPPTFDNSPTSSHSSLNVSDLGIPNELNMAAGCNLLAKYEDDWQKLHSAHEKNATKAAQIAIQIEKIDQRVTAQKVTMTDLVNCLAGIPHLVKQINDSMETLQQVTTLSNKVETDLMLLQDLCEECALQEFLLNKEFEYSQLTQKKMADLECYRQKLAAEHKEKLQKREDHLRQIQKERQAVFDDAFRGDLEEYKQKGTLPRINKEVSKGMALEEVELENTETKDALEEFLNE